MQGEPEIFDFIRVAALDGMWYWDLEKPENEWMDHRFWDTLGYADDKLPHKAASWQDKIHPEDRDRALELFQEHIDDPKIPYDLLVRYYHKDGHLVWVRCRGVALRDSKGKAVRMLGAHNEVTELKRSEALLEKASELARIGFWEVDLHNNKAHWSKVTKEIHEVPEDFEPDVATGINFYREGNSRERIAAHVSKAIEEGQSFDDELEIVTASGSFKWVRAIGIPEIYKGKCVRLYGLFQDIDFHVNSRAAIRSERELYRQVIEGANIGAWEINVDTEDIIVNANLAKILGYNIEELRRLGYTDWFDLIHQEERPTFDQQLEDCLKGRSEEMRMEARVRRRNNSYIWIALTGKIFRPNPYFSESRLVGTLQDISPFKQKSEVLKTFISDNPLAIAMFDTKMRYISYSKKWCKDNGVEESDLLGKNHYEVFPSIRQEWKEFHRRCLQGETIREEDDSFEPSPGNIVYLRWEIRPWYKDNNKIGGMIMFTENTTERKQAEFQLKSMLKQSQKELGKRP